MSDRYYVIETRGYRVDVTNHASQEAHRYARDSSSYAVLDRVYCHKEVAVFRPQHVARMYAERLCARLNAADKAAT